jgi:hypothetical protein
VSNLVCVDKQLDDTNTCVRGRVVAEGNVGFWLVRCQTKEVCWCSFQLISLCPHPLTCKWGLGCGRAHRRGTKQCTRVVFFHRTTPSAGYRLGCRRGSPHCATPQERVSQLKDREKKCTMPLTRTWSHLPLERRGFGKVGVIAQVSVKVRAPLSDARRTRPVPQRRFTPSLHTRLAQHWR